MSFLHCVLRVFPLSLMILSAGVVYCQDYPNRPIRIVTGGAGGGNDFTARQIAQGISGPLAQPVIVENRASGIISAGIVSKAQPDGYTLLVHGSSFWIGTLLQEAPYDPVRDFSPITLVGTAPSIVVVHPSASVKSVKELIAVAKARPGALNYAAGAIGSSNHLGAELFKSMAGVNIVQINYKSTGQAVTGMLAGEVQLMFGNIAAFTPHVRSGKLIALAVTSAQPSALAPGLPTVAASGLPRYEMSSADAVFVTARTPVAIIKRLNQEIVRLLKTSEVKEKIFNAGTEVVGSSPEELAALIRSELATMGKLIKDAGIKVE